MICWRRRVDAGLWIWYYRVFRGRGRLVDLTLLPLSSLRLLYLALHLLFLIHFLQSDPEVIHDPSLTSISNSPVVLLVEGLERHVEQFGPLLLQRLVHHRLHIDDFATHLLLLLVLLYVSPPHLPQDLILAQEKAKQVEFDLPLFEILYSLHKTQLRLLILFHVVADERWILDNRLHYLDESECFVRLEELLPLFGSLGPDLLFERIPVEQRSEFVGLDSEKREGLDCRKIWVVEVRELVGLPENHANITEVRAFLNYAVVVHACVVHHVYFAADDEVDVPRLIEGIIDYRQVDLVRVEDVGILLTRMIRTIEAEVEVENELTLEVQAALVQNIREQLILCLEDCIKHSLLQSWLQLAEEFVVEHHLGGVMTELLLVKSANIFEYKFGEELLGHCFVQLDEPEVDELLVLLAQILCPKSNE